MRLKGTCVCPCGRAGVRAGRRVAICSCFAACWWKSRCKARPEQAPCRKSKLGQLKHVGDPTRPAMMPKTSMKSFSKFHGARSVCGIKSDQPPRCAASSSEGTLFEWFQRDTKKTPTSPRMRCPQQNAPMSWPASGVLQTNMSDSVSYFVHPDQPCSLIGVRPWV